MFFGTTRHLKLCRKCFGLALIFVVIFDLDAVTAQIDTGSRMVGGLRLRQLQLVIGRLGDDKLAVKSRVRVAKFHQA